MYYVDPDIGEPIKRLQDKDDPVVSSVDIGAVGWGDKKPRHPKPPEDPRLLRRKRSKTPIGCKTMISCSQPTAPLQRSM